MVIKHLTHQSIDMEQWDNAVDSSANGLVYARSWFLNVLAPGWEALVEEHYRFIFPVPVKRKYKLPYIVQPKLTQQLGIFSALPVNSKIIKAFIQKLPSYSYELYLNEANVYKEAEIQPNFVLDLNKPYDQLSKSFTKNTRRNIDKATKSGIKVTTVNVDDFMQFYRTSRNVHQMSDLKMLENLINSGLSLGELKLTGVIDHDGALLATLCFTIFKNRLTFLLPVVGQEGKKALAMFYLVDELIRQNVNSDVLLDFEGSREEGVARFYESFGAINRPYYKIKSMRPSFLVGKL
jgi:hypothetical protein